MCLRRTPKRRAPNPPASSRALAITPSATGVTAYRKNGPASFCTIGSQSHPIYGLFSLSTFTRLPPGFDR
jgi:hypothetical protein